MSKGLYFNLQQKLYQGAKVLKDLYFEDVELPDIMINVGHFNREHGHYFDNWQFGDEVVVSEIFIDAMAFNKGSVYIWSILHHEMVMLLLKGKGTGSFDSRTKAFEEEAKKRGLNVTATPDRFKFVSAKRLVDHTPEWQEIYSKLGEHPLTQALDAIEAIIYPDLVSKRMVTAFEKAKETGSYYPLPGDLIKPGTGGRAKKDYKFVKVKVKKETEEDEVVKEAKKQYQDIRKVLDDAEDFTDV